MKNENMGAEDLHLESDNTLLDKAEYIAKSTLIDDKFAFLLYYDANQKEFLLSVLQTIEAVVERDDEERHVVFAMLNMAQLAFIKGLGCLTKVRTNERSNPFPEEELAKFKSDQNGEQVGETNAEEQGSIPVAEDPVTLEATTKVEATTVQAQVTMGIATENEISKDGIADVSAEVLATGPSVRCSSNTSMAAALEISDDSGTSGNIAYPGAEQWFKFTATASCQYTIYTMGNLDTIGTLYDDDKNLICEVNDYAPCGKINFRIIRNLTAGKTYYVRVRVDGDDTDTYELIVTKNVLANYVTINKSTITLEKDVLYELPITPNYTYKGYKGARRIPGLSVSISPSNATEQRIDWYAENGTGLKFTCDWDGDGDRYIHVTATRTGTAKLYAIDWMGNGKRDECTIGVETLYCGGENYRDVTQHSLRWERGYYICRRCGYRIKSPALQDKDILSTDDYLRVIGTMHYLAHNVLLAQKYPLRAYFHNEEVRRCKIVVDTIRSKPQYSALYEYQGANNKYLADETNEAMVSFVAKTTIDEFSIGWYNGVYAEFIESIGMLVVGYYCPEVAALLDVVSLIGDMVDGKIDAMSFGAFVAGLCDLDDIEMALNFFSLASNVIDCDVLVGDPVVRISFSAYAHAEYVFDVSFNIKKISIKYT